MKKPTGIVLTVCFVCLLPVFLPACKDLPLIVINTELGNIIVEIDTNEAPVTASNFLKYVDQKLFKGASFYRTVTMDNQTNPVKIKVIQGGTGMLENAVTLPPIKHETTEITGLKHLNGTISMARAEPGTASSEFFICIGDQPELDYGGNRNPDKQGFAAFGRVIKGMDVVKKIHQQPRNKQMLTPQIKIFDIKRLR